MRRRMLGQGLSVSSIGLGCMGMSEGYGHRLERECTETMARAIDCGMDFLDTADCYAVGQNERLVGRVLRKHRGQVALATKFGIVRDTSGAFIGINGRPDYVRIACDASLKRLNVDVIDLYYLHRIDQQVPLEDTIDAMADLVRRGKVRHLGLCEVTVRTLRRAHAVHPIAAVQAEYSLLSRDPEGELLAACRELGAGLVAASPLGRGLLAGQIHSLADLGEGDWRAVMPRFQEPNFQKNVDLVQKAESLARRQHCRPAQLALAWLLSRGEDLVPIPGLSRQKYVDEIAEAVEVSLTAGALEELDHFFAPGAAAGDRYSEAAQALLDK